MFFVFVLVLQHSHSTSCFYYVFSFYLSTPGVAVLLSPDIPVQLGVESRQQFCLQSLPGMERLPLQYSVCVARHIKAVHQEAVLQLSPHSRELPNMRTLWLVPPCLIKSKDMTFQFTFLDERAIHGTHIVMNCTACQQPTHTLPCWYVL